MSSDDVVKIELIISKDRHYRRTWLIMAEDCLYVRLWPAGIAQAFDIQKAGTKELRAEPFSDQDLKLQTVVAMRCKSGRAKIGENCKLARYTRGHTRLPVRLRTASFSCSAYIYQGRLRLSPFVLGLNVILCSAS